VRRVVVFLGSEDYVVVFISDRLEAGPVSSGVGVFPEVFSMSDSRSKSTEGRSKPGVGWGLTSGEFCDDRCMFIK